MNKQVRLAAIRREGGREYVRANAVIPQVRFCRGTALPYACGGEGGLHCLLLTSDSTSGMQDMAEVISAVRTSYSSTDPLSYRLEISNGQEQTVITGALVTDARFATGREDAAWQALYYCDSGIEHRLADCA